MDPRKFQELAIKLASGTNPAEIRSAISRSYYSVFNVGVELIRGMGIHVSKGPSAHEEIERDLGNSGHSEVQKVGSQLGGLRSQRNKADYQVRNKKIENQKTAQALVLQAGKMIKTLDRCFTGPERDQLMKAIREYLRKTSQRI